MENNHVNFKTIDEYIALFPEAIQGMLNQLRDTIRAAAPQAEEKISYRMPTFAQQGNLVHFAVFKEHIGFYPTPSGIQEFKDELSQYEGTKGSIHFPLHGPLPLEFVSKVVKFRLEENLKKAAAKKAKRPKQGGQGK